jgi:hypothetical protein
MAVLVGPCLCSRDDLAFLEVSSATIASGNVIVLFLVEEFYRVGTRGLFESQGVCRPAEGQAYLQIVAWAVILSFSGWSSSQASCSM